MPIDIDLPGAVSAPDTLGAAANECRAIGKPAFVERYPDPWLVQLGTTGEYRQRPSPIAPVDKTPSINTTRWEDWLHPRAPIWPVVKRTEAFPDHISVGRGDANDIRIAVASVSMVHLLLERDGLRCWVTDIGSKNGTKIDDQVIRRGERVKLTDGQVMRLGGVAIVLYTSSAGLYELTHTIDADAPR